MMFLGLTLVAFFDLCFWLFIRTYQYLYIIIHTLTSGKKQECIYFMRR